MNSIVLHHRRIALLISAAFGFGGVHWLTAGEPAPFVAAGEVEPLSQPIGEAFAGVDDTIRYVPTTRRAQPEPQKPPLSTEKNTDTNRPVDQWQRLTDDWGGLRPQLDDRGIAVALSATGDYGKVLKGGANTEDDDFAYLINFNITIDTERLFKLSGGTFFVNFQENGGTDVAENSGNIMGITNIAADNRSEISEIWYEQILFEDKLRLKAGKIDVNAEFAASEHAAEFLNPGAENPITNVGLPSYPDPAFGGLAAWRVCNGFTVSGGIFDGAGQEGVTTGDDGPATLFGSPSDLFLIAEAAVNWDGDKRPGRLALGAMRHTGTFDRFDGGIDHGTETVYAIFDQLLYKEVQDDDDTQGIGLFARFSVADDAVCEAHWHAGVGGVWQGMIPDRDDDVAGLAAYAVRFTDSASAGFVDDYEVDFELFYKIQLTRFASIKPDLQYIVNPGGTGDLDDALVASVRFALEF